MSHNRDNRDKPQVVTRDTNEDTKKEEGQINNTNLGLQMTGLQTEEGKTVQDLGEYRTELDKAEQKKAKETLKEAQKNKE